LAERFGVKDVATLMETLRQDHKKRMQGELRIELERPDDQVNHEKVKTLRTDIEAVGRDLTRIGYAGRAVEENSRRFAVAK
jgi:hypothetical protein